MRILIFIATLTVAALVQAEQWQEKAFPALSEAECKAKGGYFGKLGIGSHPPECNLPTSDKGRRCTSSSQCEGYCLAIGTPKEGDTARGLCSDRQKLFTCRIYVEGGLARHVCVD